jgi:hypothetical protein
VVLRALYIANYFNIKQLQINVTSSNNLISRTIFTSLLIELVGIIQALARYFQVIIFLQSNLLSRGDIN